MKDLHPALRISAQVVLCGPVLALSPLAIFMGIGAIYFVLRGESHGLSKDIGYGFSWLGVIGLAMSIFTPTRIFQRSVVMRRLVTGLILCGYFAIAAILLEPGSTSAFLNLWSLWMFGGPVVVGAWNLARVWSWPIQPPQTTTGSSAPGHV